MGAADEEELTQGPSGGRGGGDEKILVSVRLRPLNEKEITRNDVSDWECINDDTVIYRNNLSVSERSMYPTAYVFDKVFRPDCATSQVYEEGAKEVALSVVTGINSSIFAYGQTSSGKTYTMSGITEYTVADIYDYMNKHKAREYVLKFSAMEIYNESVRDLLSTDTAPLRLLDDPERGTVVERLTEETVRNWNHFKELLSVCEAQRQIGETSMNEASSRSHQILRLTIESSAREFLGNDKSSALSATVNFIDLAGSERASQASSAGMRLKEGCHINRSLLTLGTVIRKLSKGRNGHIPFRDSKLTRILQSSLGGNARTAIICTISPARSHVEQSRNTLLFASCAKEVATNARVNVVVSDKALVKQLQRELARMEGELRSAGSYQTVTSDSTAILREKDLQIEKLTKEVVELNRQLELARCQVENLLRMAEDDGSSIVSGDPDHLYPKLRVRSSFRSENSVAYSPASEDPRFLDIGIRSFDASQCSAGDASSTSDENFINLTDFEENFVQTDSSLELSICNPNPVEDDRHLKNSENESHETLSNICKEVQCITDEESTANRYPDSQMFEASPHRYEGSNSSSPNITTGTSGVTICKEVLCTTNEESTANGYSGSKMFEVSPHRYEDSNASSPNITTGTSGVTICKEVLCTTDEESTANGYSGSKMFEASPHRFEDSNTSSPNVTTGTSGVTEVENEDREIQELGSSPLKEQEELSCLSSDFIIQPPEEQSPDEQSPEEQSPWLLEEGIPRDRSLKIVRSKSCGARLTDMPACLFEKVEKMVSATPMVFAKDFTKRTEASQMNIIETKHVLDVTKLSRDVSLTFAGSAAVDDYQLQSIEATIGWQSAASVSNSDMGMKDLVAHLELETNSLANEPTKNVKDIGLDPIQDDLDNAPKWPSEFKKLQGDIIELWHACSVSLIHRTYFFLLFKGDPTDSFYMEVEIRRLSFLKDTFANGKETMVDGRALSLASSKRDLYDERQMLCREMQKRLTREERENVFLKWGISLTASNRRMQLVHRLWTKTTDMDHILESATLVAKLIGFEGQEQNLKQMFGLLNFTPRRPSRRRSSIWKRSVMFLL
ncbi:kinesin-like protein KIN-7H [Mercurialis annua]|uniref:kinesin-like protein KIN-7H n=1 Tax=Mercurialis annua TaxID=3986 RepID=UPI002160F62C|nr:kinesin-like protein KIN-7H [Mercurialis annua]XP_055961604.1 kinesin-like protein KIN-7H [Mercurialis annua]XP_055961605.1 kinesin-like protein KIN-7H [Mercurialis annua]XP_055961606.1 kinesin-like protein KIN-7H [Mercurialis annua]